MGKLILATLITLGTIVSLHVWWLHAYDGLFSNTCFLLLDGLYLLLAAEAMFAAFCLLRAQPSWWRALLGRGALVLASVVFIIAVADLYIVLLRFDTSGPGGVHCFTHRNWYNRFVAKNQLGYWERDLTPFLAERKPGEQVVIAAVGDSFTWGQGVLGTRYRFSNLLEPALQADSTVPVTVLNFAHGGKDTKDEILMLEDVAKVHPDIVLLCYLSNDIGDYAKITWTAGPPPSTIERWLSVVDPTLNRISPIYNFVYWTMRAPAQYRHNGNVYFDALYRAYRDPEIMRKHLDDVEAMITRVKAMDAQPVLVIVPFPSMWHEEPDSEVSDSTSKRALRDHVYAALAERARSLGAAVIDASRIEDEMTPQEFAVNAMDSHPNVEAHRRISQVIATELAKLRK